MHILNKEKIVTASMLCASLLFSGCGNNSVNNSTAEELNGAVSTNGSTSMEHVIGVLSEQFMADNRNVKITYDATGSGTGIEAVANGTADIGLASRDLKDSEKEKGLVQETVALDGIAMIVNAKNKIEDITVEQIASIYTGEVMNWAEVGGDSLEIAAIGREAGSGTRDGFETVTHTKDKNVLTQELTSTGAVVEAVRNSENAIGYASYSSVEGKEGIKVIAVNGVKCSEETIFDGSYVVQRNFNLVLKKDAELSPAAKAFYEYMLSEAAYELIEKAGVVPAGK